MMPGSDAAGGPDMSGTRKIGVVPKDMFEIFVNGIFAFAMTLIVRNNIRLPTSVPEDEVGFLLSYTANLFNDGLHFLFLFILIAVFYIIFFEIMQMNRIVDRRLVALTSLFLLAIIFFPLTSLLWALSQDPVPYGMIFHANILLAGVMLWFIWRHVRRVPGISTGDIDPWIVRNLNHRLIIFPATAVVGLLIDSYEGSFSRVPIMVLYIIPILIFIWLSHDSPPQSGQEPESGGPPAP